MKKILIAIIALFPLLCSAQNVKPLTPEQQLEQAQKQLEEAQKAVEAAKANAQKAKQAAEQAKAKADAEKAKADAEKKRKEKEIAEKQATIQAQIKKAQEEAARLNEEAEKLNAEAKKMNAESSSSAPQQKVVVTSDQTKTVKKESVTPAPKQEKPAQYGSVNGWSAISAPTPTVRQEVKPEVDVNTEVKYLAGAVPLVDGKVVFELNLDVPGQTASEIYDKAFEYVNNLTVDENQKDDSQLRSKIAIVNTNTHSIAAKMYEWLVFANTILMSDKVEFSYTMIVNCADAHLNVRLERISYTYEPNRSTGFTESAHNIIADKYALNKKQTKVVRPYGKFRIKTIDRKDEIFNGFVNLFN